MGQSSSFGAYIIRQADNKQYNTMLDIRKSRY